MLSGAMQPMLASSYNTYIRNEKYPRKEPALVAQSHACQTAGQEIAGSIRKHSFVGIDLEMFSLLHVQAGQLSISGKRMCTSTG